MGDHGHLRGQEEPPATGEDVGVGGVKGKEKWRPDGTGAPEGRLGERKGSHA